MEKIQLSRRKTMLIPVTLVTLALILLVSGSVFADTLGPTFSAVSPADNAVMNSDSFYLTLTISDPDNVDASSVIMKVDGVQVAPIKQYDWIDEWTDDYTTLYIYYQGRFSNGIHNVEVSARDGLGNLSDKSWSFTVGQPLQITALSPTDGAVVVERRPVISAVVKGGSAIDQTSVIMTVDGNKVKPYFDPIAGKVSFIPLADMANETAHTATLTAADISGSSASAQWRFTVNSFGEMPITVDDAACQKCHPRADHLMNSCGKCHGLNINPDIPVYPIDDCYGCHYDSTSYPAVYHTNGLPLVDGPDHPVRVTASCVECHTQNWMTVPVYHNVTDTTNRHITTTTGCETCHATSLTREHQRRTDSNGNNLTCNTCHNSTDTKVQVAIEDKNSACSACHNLGPTGGHPAHSNGLDSNCQTCHTDSVLTEKVFHQQNGCSTCHNAKAPDIVKYSISTANTSCFSCHNQGHNVNFVQLVPADVPQYPGFKWTVPQDASIFSQEPWFNEAYNTIGAKMIISNRLQTVNGQEVYNWYAQNMSDQGWVKTDGPTQGSDNFAVTFTKGVRIVTVIFYGGETHNLSSPFVGYRLEIFYK